jgi:BirA family transcriptional regulator, biotin operon repressor / biotin---[acetyl-CoA-carboxylase] ligase
LSSAASSDARVDSYDGAAVDSLAAQLGLRSIVAFSNVGSTLDVAHALATRGASGGTLVVADAQSAGRGRMGRTWQSEAGAGVWLTLIEQPPVGPALDVLSLRVGLALAPALEPLAESSIRLKWPNDLYVRDRKLAGILVEARWRDGAPEWVAIGVGINVRVPRGEPKAAGLIEGTRRLDVLTRAVSAIREAVTRTGPLGERELADFAARDLAVGRACLEPVRGRVLGIDASGALKVDVGSEVALARGGSLVLQEDSP